MKQQLNTSSSVNEPVQERPFVLCEGLVRIYRALELEVMALQGLDLRIDPGELVAIIGSSGSGKTTLLNILGGLDSPSAGKALVGGWNLSRMTPNDRVRYKRETVGFVWQNVGRNLIPYLTALENVELPMILNGRLDKAWAEELLRIVGLADRMRHRPGQMSGGQQQRVAIAIALANKPKLLLADEPTGSLDTRSAHQVLEVFRSVRSAYGITIIAVTHDRQMAKEVDRTIQIRDGKVSTETVRRTPTGHAWDEEETQTHDEYIVLDSAGRLQIPKDHLASLGISSRARVHMRDGEIVIKPE